MPERPTHHDPGPDHPRDLPPELAEFLKDQPLAALLHRTDHGTALIVKLPGHEIESVRGPVPIEVTHALYAHPAAPVVRVVTRIYDQPQHPLALETYINVDDEDQREDYGALTGQEELELLFYDELLQRRLAKRVRNPMREGILKVLISALRLRAQIPNARFDFDRAKADVIDRTSL